jgi:hypothetical protein
MSLIPIGISVGIAFAEGLISPVFTRFRNIGGMIADITVEELHTDTTEITNQPVEVGAAITDHAFDLPQRVQITAAWSNSSQNADGDPNYIQETYAAFLALKSARMPFDIVTGKRMYTNMLIERITERTDKHWENAMQLVIECRQVILVTTQTVSVPDASVMNDPSSNGATQNTGSNYTAPASNLNADALPSTANLA